MSPRLKSSTWKYNRASVLLSCVAWSLWMQIQLLHYTMLRATAPAVTNLRNPRQAAAKFRSSLPCFSWNFHRLIFFLQCRQSCSEGSLVSLVSYYPPAGRRGPVCTKNARQAVLSKTVNAESLHQSIKARNTPAWQWLWGTTWDCHFCCCRWDSLHAGQGDGPKRAEIPIQAWENSPAALGHLVQSPAASLPQGHTSHL